jgi:hypothetical protein
MAELHVARVTGREDCRKGRRKVVGLWISAKALLSETVPPLPGLFTFGAQAWYSDAPTRAISKREASMAKAIVFLLGLLGVSGCVHTQCGPTAEELASGFGSPPEKVEEPIKAAFNEILRDPFSAQYEFGSPRKAWWGHPGALAVNRWMRLGWGVPVRVNAKNGFGGYTGWKAYVVFLRDGVVHSMVEPNEGRMTHFGYFNPQERPTEIFPGSPGPEERFIQREPEAAKDSPKSPPRAQGRGLGV